MTRLIAWVDALMGLWLKRRSRITVGDGSRVRWWGLGLRGGGSTQIGRESIIRCRISFDSAAGRVVIGDRCFVGASHLVCHTGITIGDDVIMSWGVTIVDHDSHALAWEQRRSDVADWMRGHKRWGAVTIMPVRIADKAWIGFGASVLKGVSIGEGAVVGAGAVVTHDVPAHSVVAGNPARVVRTIGAVQP